MKKSKYGNKKVCGYDSKKEYYRSLALKRKLADGIISDLREQVKYKLEVDGKHICYYIADFVYNDIEGNEVVEDVKGYKTSVYNLKKKMMYAILGIKIQEV